MKWLKLIIVAGTLNLLILTGVIASEALAMRESVPQAHFPTEIEAVLNFCTNVNDSSEVLDHCVLNDESDYRELATLIEFAESVGEECVVDVYLEDDHTEVKYLWCS